MTIKKLFKIRHRQTITYSRDCKGELKLIGTLSNKKTQYWYQFVTLSLWRICPTTVSLLLKSEPIEINQKFKFLVEDIDV